MNNRLIEWAISPRGRITEMGPSTWGTSLGDIAGDRADAVVGINVNRPLETGCGCGCEGCGVDCGCECCAGGSVGHSQVCPTCGKELLLGGEGCDECGMAMGRGGMEDDLDEAHGMDEKACGCKGPCNCDEGKMTCDECGGMYEGEYCESCGYSPMMESVILEAKKKHKKKLSMKTQKKIAKTAVKKAGKGKDGKVSMTKLAKDTESWAKEPFAAANYRKQLAKKK